MVSNILQKTPSLRLLGDTVFFLIHPYENAVAHIRARLFSYKSVQSSPSPDLRKLQKGSFLNSGKTHDKASYCSHFLEFQETTFVMLLLALELTSMITESESNSSRSPLANFFLKNLSVGSDKKTTRG